MTFEEILDQAIAMLQRRERVTYRALQAHFQIDDSLLDILKEEILYAQPQVVDDQGKGLIWTSVTAPKAEPATSLHPLQPTAQEESSTQAEPSPPESHTPDAERRQLTVMFCDLVGSTHLSGQLDPEELRDVIRAYQAVCNDVIQRFEGHVAQHLGDGLLIYLGYPAAHEDDAQRAVRSGLGIIDAMKPLNRRLVQTHGIELAVRIGIHTGLVVIGDIGTGPRQEQLALGETPNIAARIQGLAEPDTIVISDATYRLVEGYFECDTLGERALKGVAAPIHIYRVLNDSGAQGRLDMARTRGLTPLVGRESEVAILLERWEQVRHGQGQVVLVSGDAGIGKSRLLQTLRDHASDEPHARWECRSSPYFSSSALYPITDLMQRALRWQPDDAPEQKLHQLEHHLSQYRLPLEETVPLFGALLSLPVPEDRYPPLTWSPQRLRQKTLECLVAILMNEAERQPLLFILEDAHWLDATTLELLTLLIDQVPTSAVFILITHRPEFQAPWGNRSYLTPIVLNRLSREGIEQMAAKVAGGKTLPDEVLQELAEKTDGVPLYVEEMTKSVLESGVLKEVNGQYELTGSISSLSIPATLQDSLMSRLDRLVTAKAVAQYASVIGRQFTYELLQAVSERDEMILQKELNRLVESELVYQRGLPPQAVYTFKHALIQDTAYGSLLRSTRQGYHRRIAEVLEARFPETVDQQPEWLAYHCTQAGLDEQAVTYWHQAGQRARSRSAHVEAASHLTAGLNVLKRMPDTPSRTQQELVFHLPLGSSLLVAKGNGSSEVEQTYLRARELCEQLGDTHQLARVLMALNGYYINRAEYGSALEMAINLRELAERLNDSISLMIGHHAQGTTLYWQGEFIAAHVHLEQAIVLDMSQREQSVSPSVALIVRTATYYFAAFVLWALGYPEQALQRGQAALILARQYHNPFNLAATCDFVSQLYQRRRESHHALELLDTSLTLSVDHVFPHWLATGAIVTGWALSAQGHHEAGIAKLQEGIAARRDLSSAAGRAWELCLLAEAYGHGRDRNMARATLGRGLAVSAFPLYVPV